MKQHLTIREMASDDKPREKLMMHGAKTLSNAELVAILIGTGEREMTAVELSQKLLAVYDNDLSRLYNAAAPELCQIKGIGEAKACKIIAALTLGSRVRRNPNLIYQIDRPRDVAAYLSDFMFGYEQEHFLTLLLDTKNRVMKCTEVSVGTVDAAIAHPRDVFVQAVRQGASAVIVAHNHPSGDATPSKEDIQTTKRLEAAGDILGIPLLDHLIIVDDVDEFFSFKNAGYL